MRKLVTFRQVQEIRPIKDADRIELAMIDGWQCVVNKGVFTVGDTAAYFEVDSFLPLRPEYEFLRASSYRRMGEEEGFRLKTVRLRGELSQGLLLPKADLGLTGGEDEETLAERLGVKLYEPPIPAQLAGLIVGMFPSFIPKTDQERVQNLTGKLWGTGRTITYIDAEGKEVEKILPPATPRKYEVTEKLDGASTTYYSHGEAFGACSRNLDLKEDAENTLWKVAHRYGLREKLAGLEVAIQGELVGEGIQGNPYKLSGQEFFVFDIYAIKGCRYLSPEERTGFLLQHVPELKSVPVLARNFDLPPSLPERRRKSLPRTWCVPQ